MGTVRYTLSLRMVSPRVVTYFILGVLTTTTQARRPKLVQSDRSGSCPTEGGKTCVFPFKTACTTAKGPCKFPFLYKGKEYNNCTLYQSSGNRPWCATALKADGNMQQWANCDMEVCTDPHAVGGPYSECVPSVATEGKGWCATAVNEDGIFTTRDFCSNPNCVPTTTTTTTTVATTADPSICKTEGGNQCQFPFNTVCTTSKGPCMFPFLYKGKKYINCTLYQSSGGNPWCATSLRSDGNMQQWANCDMDVCQVPNGVIGPFGQCIPSVSNEGKGWCATTVDENGIVATKEFCEDPTCLPEAKTTSTTTTTSTTGTTTEDSDCGCDIPTECIVGFSGSVYNTTEDFMGLADFFTRVGGLIEKGVGDLLTFLIPPTEAPPTGLPFGPIDNGTIPPLQTTEAPARKSHGHGRSGRALSRKGLFEDEVKDLILSGERTDCRVLANQISGGALDNALGLVGLRNLAVLKEDVQEATNRGVFDNIAAFISKAGIVIPEECVCECGCQRIPTKPAATTAAPATAAADQS